MNRAAFSTLTSEVSTAIDVILENAAFIAKETPTLTVSQNRKAEVLEICNAFEETLIFDVRKEVGTLADKLGLHPGEEPLDPNVVNPDPLVNIRFIREWTWQEIAKLDRVIRNLPEDTKGTEEIQFAILLRESGANILSAYERLCAATDEISRLWAEHHR